MKTAYDDDDRDSELREENESLKKELRKVNRALWEKEMGIRTTRMRKEELDSQNVGRALAVPQNDTDASDEPQHNIATVNKRKELAVPGDAPDIDSDDYNEPPKKKAAF